MDCEWQYPASRLLLLEAVGVVVVCVWRRLTRRMVFGQKVCNAGKLLESHRERSLKIFRLSVSARFNETLSFTEFKRHWSKNEVRRVSRLAG